MLFRRAAPAWLIPLALAVVACAGGSGTQSTAGSSGHPGPGRVDSAPPRDTYTGSIISATGAYSGRRGLVKVYLHPRGTGRARPVRMVFTGRCPGSAARCISLRGQVAGTLAALARGLPDTGRDYGLAGSGRVSPLGRVRINGVVAGTGFISHAHLLMRLTVITQTGRLMIVAHSGGVNGFTSP